MKIKLDFFRKEEKRKNWLQNPTDVGKTKEISFREINWLEFWRFIKKVTIFTKDLSNMNKVIPKVFA